MKVSMLVNTSFCGRCLRVGDEVEVESTVAKRWEKRKIASPINEDREIIDFSKHTAKALYEMCIEAGIKVEQKQQKEVYIKLLTENKEA